MAKISLSSPWVTYVRELEELFRYDPEVHIVYDDENFEVKVYVDSSGKATALNKLLQKTRDYGTVSLSTEVVPANSFKPFVDKSELYNVAFSGNGALSFIKTVKGVFSNDLTYVVFRKQVVQYFNDDLGDIYGQKSTLYQEIAKDVLGEKEGVFFCTDVEDPVLQSGKAPLGEWP